MYADRLGQERSSSSSSSIISSSPRLAASPRRWAFGVVRSWQAEDGDYGDEHTRTCSRKRRVVWGALFCLSPWRSRAQLPFPGSARRSFVFLLRLAALLCSLIVRRSPGAEAHQQQQQQPSLGSLPTAFGVGRGAQLAGRRRRLRRRTRFVEVHDGPVFCSGHGPVPLLDPRSHVPWPFLLAFAAPLRSCAARVCAHTGFCWYDVCCVCAPSSFFRLTSFFVRVSSRRSVPFFFFLVSFFIQPKKKHEKEKRAMEPSARPLKSLM